MCDLSSDLSRLYSTGEFSDFVIGVEDKEFPVHKAVLAARSPVFRAMLGFPAKESQENRVTIEDLKSDVVEQMLMFMYTAAAPDIDRMAEDLLLAANKYQLPRLVTICAEHLRSKLSIENATDMLLLADACNLPQFMSVVTHFIGVFREDVVKTESFQRLLKDRPEFIASKRHIFESEWECSSWKRCR
ncbi:speckle-type POZ protein B-like [Ornithodoros turicata]|uniref:speckle-type POZ protein B-like n=1 Tax=Ornithodoros turicata TaxID=34597 RepID=UPI00313967CF